MIGWVAEVTLAQDPAKKPGWLPSPDLIAQAPAPVQDSPAPVSELTLIGSTSPVPPSEPPVGFKPAEIAETAPTSRLHVASGAISSQASTTEPSRPSEPDDPEMDALAFVEQNQKLAESQLKNLKDEEAKLGAAAAKG